MSDAISMDTVREKLKNLRESRPREDEYTYAFAEFLANRLNDKLNPQGFYMTMQIVLMDLQTGIDGFSGKPINNNLACLPPTMYAMLQLIFIDNIVDIVCPKEFAENVKDVDKHVMEKMKKSGKLEDKNSV